MRLLGRLLATAVPVIAGRGFAAAWVYGAAFPLARPQVAALHATLLAAAVVEAVAVTWHVVSRNAAFPMGKSPWRRGARAPGSPESPL